MANQEIFVQVDASNNVIGPIEKKTAHDGHILHQTASVLVFNPQGQLLMQLRAEDRELYPGQYTLSATGHVDWLENGPENIAQAAKREYFEELGKKPVNPLQHKFTTELDVPGHHTMTAVYFTQDEEPFYPNTKEVQRVEFMDIEEVKSIADKITPPSRMVLQKLGLI